MAILYTFAIDHDDDGALDGTDEIITDYVLEAQWRLGLSQPYDSVAPPAMAEITVRNNDGRFSPQNGLVTIGKRLRILSDDGTTTRCHFTGYITKISPNTRNQKDRTAILIAHDSFAQLQTVPLSIAPQINQTADVIIGKILQQVSLRYPVLKGRWLLGRVQHSELADHTRFVTPHSHALQTGQTIFAYVGDTWTNVTALQALQDIVEAERGRLFVNREGVITFLNRHHLLKNETVQATLSDDFEDADYVFGDDVWARVVVQCRPRSLGTPNTILWESKNVISIAPHSEIQFGVVWRDSTDSVIGAIDVQTPRPNVDFYVNTASDGNGQNVSASFSWAFLTINFVGATVQIRNPLNQTVYLLAGASLLGTPIVSDSALAITYTSQAAQNIYNGNTRQWDMPLLDNLQQADALARFELSRHKTPQGNLYRVTLNARQHTQAVLARSLFERVTLHNTQTNYHADAFIVAEAHHLTDGGYTHHVTWQLEPASANRFWLLARRKLASETILSY